MRKDKMVSTCKSASGYPVAYLWSKRECRTKPFRLLTLMKESFNLAPPDKHHFYYLAPKDGVQDDYSLENLIWKIRLCGDWKYYPEPFYDDAGTLIQKQCCICGKKKEISKFHLFARFNGKYYMNSCRSCRAAKWNRSENGKIRNRKYEASKTERMTNWYMKRLLTKRSKLVADDITPQMMGLQRKCLTIHRKLKTKNK